MFCSQFFGLLSNTAKTTEFDGYQMSISIRHVITEVLLRKVLNTINLNPISINRTSILLFYHF